MQYANVLINRKVRPWDATFTYSIPPEILPSVKIGSIVLVPFGPKEIEGVIIDLKRNIPHQVQSKLKSILRILQPDFSIFRSQIDFAKFLANTYYSTWGEALFASIPPIPRRPMQIPDLILEKKIQSTSKCSLLLADTPTRWQYYLKESLATLKQQKSVYIIFPDNNLLHRFKDQFSDTLSKLPVIEYTSSDNQSKRFNKWLKLLDNKPKLILGSRLCLLTLSPNTGLIIIDDSNHSGLQEDQSPRYNARDVARYWSEKFGINVVEGDILPSSGQLYEIKRHRLFLISKSIPIPKCEIKLVDISNVRSPMSPYAEERISQTIENKKSVVIFSPHKGSGGTTMCLNCEHIFICDKCAVPLISNNKNIMTCHHCRGEKPTPFECPNCHSQKIKSFGWGVENIALWLSKNLQINAPIILVDKENIPKKFPACAIYISTQAIFRYPIKPAVTCVLKADTLFNKPDYSASEIAFRTLHQLAHITQEELTIQSEKIDMLPYQALQKHKYLEYFQSVLKERKNYDYPPYGHLIKIVIENNIEAKAASEAEKLYKKIFSSKLDVTTLGPSPAYFSKIRDKYRWQITLKSRSKISVSNLQSVITGNYEIDYNPTSLL